MTLDAHHFAERGKEAYAAKKYNQAVEAFSQAAALYESRGDLLTGAEMKNNGSVALLQSGNPQAALEAVAGTDELFANAGDLKRQALAVGNRAAALEALKKHDQALEAYEQSAQLFAEAGEDELRSIVLQSAAALKLKRGKMLDSAFSMIGSVEASQKPTLIQRLLKLILRLRS